MRMRRRYAPFWRARHRKLADLTIATSEWLAQVLGITARRIRSVTLNNAGAKADLLVHLCGQLGAARYISPLGSHDYLADSDAFAKAGIELCYQATSIRHTRSSFGHSCRSWVRSTSCLMSARKAFR